MHASGLEQYATELSVSATFNGSCYTSEPTNLAAEPKLAELTINRQKIAFLGFLSTIRDILM